MKYVALLRGINPVNASNAKLITVFEGLGCIDVQTIGSSGNVVFTNDAAAMASLEKAIEQALAKLLASAHNLAMVRSARQIKKLVDQAPFGERIHSPASYLTVTFFKHVPDHAVPIDRHAIAYDRGAGAICTVNDNTKRPSFMAQLEHIHGRDITTRTWNTVLKIARKLEEEGMGHAPHNDL